MHEKARNGELDRLDNGACIDAYGQLIQSTRRNLLLVVANDALPDVKDPDWNNTDVYNVLYYSIEPPYGGGFMPENFKWLCDSIPALPNNGCVPNLAHIRADADNWAPGGLRVGYCLSEKAPGQCQLVFKTPIAVLVVILNFAKAAMMSYLVFGITENPMMTMGDAVREFLTRNDPTTVDMCLLERDDMVDQPGEERYFPAGPKVYKRTKRRWMDVASRRRWWICFLMFAHPQSSLLCTAPTLRT